MPFSEGSYDPETLALMANALEEALHELEFDTNARGAAGLSSHEHLKATMALRIISAVRMGERDPTRLKRLALTSIDGSERG